MAAIYPDQFPVASAASLFSIIKRGAIYAERTQFVYDFYQLEGYGFRVGFGIPNVVGAATAAPMSAEARSHVESLRATMQSFDADKSDLCEPTGEAGEAGAAAERPDRPFLKFLLQNLPLLLQLLAGLPKAA